MAKKKLLEYRINIVIGRQLSDIWLPITRYLLKSAATVPDVVVIPLIPENLTIAGLPAIAGVPGVVDAPVVVFVFLLLAFLELLTLPLLHGIPAFSIAFAMASVSADPGGVSRTVL